MKEKRTSIPVENHSQKSIKVQGISFTKDGLSYKGSQVDRAFSFSKLDAQLSQVNHQKRPNRHSRHRHSNHKHTSKQASNLL